MFFIIFILIFLKVSFIEASSGIQHQEELNNNNNNEIDNREISRTSCKHNNLEPFYRKSILESTFSLLFLILFGIVLGLMILGCIKGLLGIFLSKKIGEYGIDILIDLPKPLDSYQEVELQGKQVCYDVVGWPVHPDTGERTVRILPIKTEFCLNVIFFLAYPLALTLKLCAICLCIKNYNGEDDDCFKEVNVIKCKSSKKETTSPKLDVYKDNDLREKKDTFYVINCMKQSQMSLKLKQQQHHQE